MATIKINPKSVEERRQIKRHKVNDGVNIYRILPPYGESSNGYPYHRWFISWMTDPASGRQRPYVSTLMNEKRCPVAEYVKNLQALVKTFAETNPLIKKVNEIIGEVRPKASFLYNAVDKSGVIGILDLKTTAHEDLKKNMNSYIKDYNMDPTSVNNTEDDNGVWFEFHRTGQGFKTEYSVNKAQTMKKIPGIPQPVFMDDMTPLPPSVVEGWQDLAYDIHSMYKFTTYDALKEVLLFNLSKLDVPKELYCGLDIQSTSNNETTDEDDVPYFDKELDAEKAKTIVATSQVKTTTTFAKPPVVTNNFKQAVQPSSPQTLTDDEEFFKMAEDLVKG